MEAAGWQVARRCRGRRVAVLCGPGNNGGDGLAAARHLHRWGRLAGVACAAPDRLTDAAAAEADALRALGVPIRGEPEIGSSDEVVDALFGTGLRRSVEGLYAGWIRTLNASGRRVLSIDVPSGLDSDSGDALGACVKAEETLTLGLPKPGLFERDGPAHAGQVVVADIGIPREAYAAAGVAIPPDLFGTGDAVEVTSP